MSAFLGSPNRAVAEAIRETFHVERESAQVSENPLVFIRRDPQKYVLLYARVGPDGAILGTENFKPRGTEYATEEEVLALGYVPEKWRDIAIFVINYVNQRTTRSDDLVDCLTKRFGKSLFSKEFWELLDRETKLQDAVPAAERGVAMVPVEE